MYQFTFYTHVIISLITLIAGVLSMLLAWQGYRKKRDYNSGNRLISSLYLAALYAQLLLGLIMYYYHGSDKNILANGPIQPGNSPTIRLWEIEHVAVMVFALFLVQIGIIFIAKTKSSTKKYLLSFWYLGVPLLLMMLTMAMALR